MSVHDDRKSDCEKQYPLAGSYAPSFKTVLLTIFILLLSLAIELGIHAHKKSSCNEALRDLPAGDIGQSSAQTDDQGRGESKADPPTRAKSTSRILVERLFKDSCHHDFPTPVLRANRFIGATLAIVPLCIAFAFRIKDTRVESLGTCIYHIDFVPPNWVAISIFNILPLACACTAWLRTLVDCVLFRFDTALSYEHWPHALPISLPVLLVILLGIRLRDATMYLMGQPIPTIGDPARPGREDMEMLGGTEGERQNLMGQEHATGGEDDEVTIYSPRSSGELKA
ncbi:hypothetical protein BX600DRAFT_468266 [Xylariales sp. PMI_506]|nr:hypothetical protein BX600DRAFT_468266 [Xylariales sp. PMI_506]